MSHQHLWAELKLEAAPGDTISVKDGPRRERCLVKWCLTCQEIEDISHD